MIHAFPLFVSSSKVAYRMMCSRLTKKELKFVRNIISAAEFPKERTIFGCLLQRQARPAEQLFRVE